MIIYIGSKKIKRLTVTENIKYVHMFTPFKQMLLGTILFTRSNTVLVICIIATNVFIIADKEHLFKSYRCSARLMGSTAGAFSLMF